MSFWKKSEDPWDQKPGKRRREPREPKEPQANPLDSLKAWNEDRKAKAKEREEARRLPPEKCPWCGTEMEQGFLYTGRDPVRWYPGVYKYAFFRDLDGNAVDICNEGGPFMGHYKTAWRCRECKKLVLDMPDPPAAYEPFAAPAETEETKEEEESGE